MNAVLVVWMLLQPQPERRQPQTPPPAQQQQPQPPAPAQQRTQLNLLGQTDSASGESRRNENVQFNLIDTASVKELNVRMGTTATIIEAFLADRAYFGGEYGTRPAPSLHPAPGPREKAAPAWHGSLFAAHNNSIFSARAFFQVGGVRPARENQYGASLGGPVSKRVRFSFDGSQQKLRGQVNGNVLAPLPSERTPLTNDPVLRPIVQRFLNAYRTELPNRTDIDPRMLNTNSPQTINTDNAGGRIDIQASERDRIAITYRFTGQQVKAFQLVAGQNPDTDIKSHAPRVSWFRTVSPRTTLNVTTGYDRNGTLIKGEANAVGPSVSIANFIAALGPQPPIPIDRAVNKYRTGAAMTRTKGNLQTSAGGEWVRHQVNGLEQDGNRGILTFITNRGPDGQTVDAITNLRMGNAAQYVQALGNTVRGFRYFTGVLYADGRWKATGKLTLSAGVRWEGMSRPAEVNRLDTMPFDADLNNFAPRFGFAHRSRIGAVRGAYGIHFGEIFATTFGQTRLSPPGSYRVAVAPVDLRNPLAGIRYEDVRANPNFRAGIFDISKNLATPYSHQYNFSWEPVLPGSWKMQLGYVGSRSHKLFQMWFDNRALPGVANQPLTTGTVNERRPDPRYLEIFRLLNSSRAYYDAGRVTVIAPPSKRWGAGGDVSYWFSKVIDLGNDYTSTLAGGDARTGRSQSEFHVHADLKGLSSFDQTHALMVRGNADLPVLRKWKLNGVWLLKNGTPFSVESGSDGPGFGNVDGQGSDRPHIVDPGILGRTIGNPDTSLARLPRSAFAYMQPGELRGSLGRNTFRRGKIANVNASLERTWKIPRREASVNLRGESINLFNTPQFAEPNFNLTSPSFARITNTLNDGRTFRFQLTLAF